MINIYNLSTKLNKLLKKAKQTEALSAEDKH